ncbi:MAG: hypothetical protein LBD93_06920 [Treponema sp.]|nr:hypothetical protein [Treponema sp.]
MNRLKLRFMLTVLVMLYILLYSPSLYHNDADTRKAGFSKKAYRELIADLSRRLYAYRDGSIQYLPQSVACTARALHAGGPDPPVGFIRLLWYHYEINFQRGLPCV